MRSDLSFLVDGVPGIGDQVEKDLFELVALSQNRREVFIQFERNPDILEAQLAPDNSRGRPGSDDLDRSFAAVIRLAPELTQPVDDIRGPVDLSADFLATCMTLSRGAGLPFDDQL